MKRFLAAVVLLVPLAWAAKFWDETETPIGMDSVEAPDEYSPVAVGERFDGFDWELCKALNSRSPGNVVVSPVGLKLVLAMLYEGATGKTARELETGLKMPQDRQYTRDKYSSVLASLKGKNGDYELDIGSKMFLQTGMNLRKQFVRILDTFYNTEIENVDFNAPTTVKRINEWASKTTHGHIKQLISKDSLNDAVLLLVNAIYFKGSWKYQFPKENTFNGQFYVGKGKSVTTPLMVLTDRELYYSHATKFNAKIVRLPYLGKKFSFYLVLPDDKDGLDTLVRTINPFELRDHLNILNPATVKLVMPKFNFDFAIELKHVLEEIGIRELFTRSAGLNGIAGGKHELYVSRIFQKSGLVVDEIGTTAHATTVVELPDRMGSTEVSFNATHPFMFFVEDETTGTVVFVGKVVQPTEDESSATPKVELPHGRFGTRQNSFNEPDEEPFAFVLSPKSLASIIEYMLKKPKD